MSAGELRERLAFEVRSDLRPDGDGDGNFEGEFEEQFACAARITPKLGTEPVIAQRLTGVQPVVIRIRYSRAATKIKTGWRAREARGEGLWARRTFDIKGVANVDEKSQYLDVLAVTGGLTG